MLALARWAEWLYARGLTESTIRLYSYGVFRLFHFVHWIEPQAVKEEHVVAFLTELRSRAACRAQYMRGIRSFFGFLKARGEIDADPTVGIPLRKPRRPPAVALTEEELARYFLAAAWRHPRRAWGLMLTFGLGCRRMEVASITPEDVQGSVVHLKHCKYSKQRRVELSRYAQVALEELRPWYNGTVLGGVSKSTITEWAHQAAVDSGLLPKVHGRVAHVLRASFITHLLRNGVPIQVVRDLAGHENLSTTNEYAAVFSTERAEAVARLDFGA